MLGKGAGLIWDPNTLERYIAHPEVVVGTTERTTAT
jgi:hypothetical protein